MSINNTNKKEEKDLKEVINDYLRFWYLLVLVFLLAVGIAYVYLRYSTPRYMAQASVLIKDENEMGLTGDLQSLFRFSGFSNRFMAGRIENEVAVLRSKQIIGAAIEAQQLNISYETVGTFKDSELYPYKPITVKYLSFTRPMHNNPIPALYVKVNSETEFQISTNSKEDGESHVFGETLTFPFGEITVLPELESTVPNAFDK